MGAVKDAAELCIKDLSNLTIFLNLPPVKIRFAMACSRSRRFHKSKAESESDLYVATVFFIRRLSRCMIDDDEALLALLGQYYYRTAGQRSFKNNTTKWETLASSYSCIHCDSVRRVAMEYAFDELSEMIIYLKLSGLSFNEIAKALDKTIYEIRTKWKKIYDKTRISHASPKARPAKT